MPAPAEAFTPTAGARLRLIVVEDESLVALDLEERLERLGYEVTAVVDNGPDALAYAHSVQVDLVLMDIHIRGAMDGIEAAAALRARLDLPVVFLTAHADDATLARAGRTEPFGYVLKPFDERELRAAIEMAHYRHRAEARLRKMERWLATTLHSIGDGVIATDSEGRITFLNATAEAITGWPRVEAIGRPLQEVFEVAVEGGANEAFDLLQRAMIDGVTITLGEGRFLRTRTGEKVPVDDSVAPIRNDSGWVTGCVVIFRDCAEQQQMEGERRKLEAKLAETQRLESLGVMASGIAHDFNNLLVAVTCNASLGRAMLPAESPVVACLNDIEAAADRAGQLCGQMLAYAGKGRWEMKDLELSGFTRETSKLLEIALSKNARLVLDLSAGLPPVRADRSQLQQVIMNLVINGAEALDGQAGNVTVRTRRFAADPAFLAQCRVGADLPAGDYVLLEVQDTGHGMSAETLARIFDPFFTTKLTGRGLGLAAVMGIIREHGSALAVESAPGQGTTFRVLLPPTSAQVAAPPPVPDLAWRGHGRALLVDDELAIRLAGSAVLRHLGFEVELAEDGRAGLTRLRELRGEFTVVLLDLTMPQLDGASALVELRAQYPQLPVVLMSGYTREQAERLFALGGPTAFVQKPFSLSNLVEVLTQLLGAAG